MVTEFPFLDSVVYGTGLNVVVSLSVFSCLIRLDLPLPAVNYLPPAVIAISFLFILCAQHHDPSPLGHFATW